ncbi:Protein with response regulator receiver domain [Desulfosarcina cetonica]|uniref:ATP-binding response regulator n=1 Tax=Desulfosarcina cetonica TaxID=90730 RepID=UPI0006D219A4|nr:response regulator [Desulfosarcina cetonica]VTR66502.1 Protein with response regulator receiver domain [Desulfosarcina cetonica]
MQTPTHAVLCIDDEPNILNALKRLLRKENYRLLTGSSGREGLDILAANEVHVVVSDQRMPEMNGTEFLKQVRERYPNILRIILTGYTDVDTITEAINEGHIYKFFLKPWNDHNLKLEIRQALEQYDLIQANKALHDQLYQQNEELKQMNENLESIVQERTHSLKIQNQALQVSHAILEELPLPILGISSEMLVVMVNKAARQQMGSDRCPAIGSGIGESFDDGVETSLGECLQALEKRSISARSKDGSAFDLELIPLTGRYRGRGVIMALSPVCHTPVG